MVAGETTCNPSPARSGRALERAAAAAAGPRKIVFSTFAVAVQGCVTMQSSRAAERRIFGQLARDDRGKGGGQAARSLTWATAGRALFGATRRGQLIAVVASRRGVSWW